MFPVSDHSSDVIQVLQKEMKMQGVQIHLNTKVKEILTKEGRFEAIRLEKGEKIYGDA